MNAFPQGQTADAVGVFLRCTGQDDPLRALQAVKSLGFDTVQVSRLPDRFYTPEGARELRVPASIGLVIASRYRNRSAAIVRFNTRSGTTRAPMPGPSGIPMKPSSSRTTGGSTMS